VLDQQKPFSEDGAKESLDDEGGEGDSGWAGRWYRVASQYSKSS
jgi:hypothetical protein